MRGCPVPYGCPTLNKNLHFFKDLGRVYINFLPFLSSGRTTEQIQCLPSHTRPHNRTWGPPQMGQGEMREALKDSCVEGRRVGGKHLIDETTSFLLLKPTEWNLTQHKLESISQIKGLWLHRSLSPKALISSCDTQISLPTAGQGLIMTSITYWHILLKESSSDRIAATCSTLSPS